MCCFNNGCCRRNCRCNCRCNSWCNGNNNRWPSDQEIREFYENAFNEDRYRCGGREFDPDNNFSDNFSNNFSNNFNDNFSNNQIFFINFNVDDNIEV